MEIPQGLGTVLLTAASKIVIVVVIFIVGRIVAKLLVRALTKLLQRSQIDETLVSFSELTHYSLFMLVVLIALGLLGLPMTSIVAVLGASVLAIGIALQDSIANLTSGVLIIELKPFGVGDFVEIDDVSGAVLEIGFFNISLITRQNTTVYTPN